MFGFRAFRFLLRGGPDGRLLVRSQGLLDDRGVLTALLAVVDGSRPLLYQSFLVVNFEEYLIIY